MYHHSIKHLQSKVLAELPGGREPQIIGEEVPLAALEDTAKPTQGTEMVWEMRIEIELSI